MEEKYCWRCFEINQRRDLDQIEADYYVRDLNTNKDFYICKNCLRHILMEEILGKNH